MHQSEGALGDPSCETRHFDMSFRSDDRWAFVQAKYSSWGRSAMNLAKKKKLTYSEPMILHTAHVKMLSMVVESSMDSVSSGEARVRSIVRSW